MLEGFAFLSLFEYICVCFKFNWKCSAIVLCLLFLVDCSRPLRPFPLAADWLKVTYFCWRAVAHQSVNCCISSCLNSKISSVSRHFTFLTIVSLHTNKVYLRNLALVEKLIRAYLNDSFQYLLWKRPSIYLVVLAVVCRPFCVKLGCDVLWSENKFVFVIFQRMIKDCIR
jgi:hypothetical protein